MIGGMFRKSLLQHRALLRHWVPHRDTRRTPMSSARQTGLTLRRVGSPPRDRPSRCVACVWNHDQSA